MTTDGGYVEYRSNNSGGGWWLSDDDWKALEEAGWEVEWLKDDDFYSDMLDGKGRWLGALAKSAKRSGVSLRVAIAEWQDATGQNPDDNGCNCCGQPHNFYAYDENDRMVW